MRKKVLAILLAAIMVLSAGGTALAAPSSFSDVDSTQYAWAVDAIEDMTNNGIIKGYTDGTFRPDIPISNIQALVLSARVLGFTLDNNRTFTDYASEMYRDVLAAYSTSYQDEVAYLLYKGALKPGELNSYIGNGVVNEGMKRYQVAVLLTKVMDGEEEAKAAWNNGAALPFTDLEAIPESARPSVWYVYNQGLMGTMNTDGGVNEFVPNFAITRAQMAVLLYRVLGKNNMSLISGTLSSINTTTGAMTVRDTAGDNRSLSAGTNTKYMVNGEPASVGDLTVGCTVAVISYNNIITRVEAIKPVADNTVSGKLSAVTNDSYTIDDVELGTSKTYPLADGVDYYVNGEKKSFSAVARNMYVTVQLSGGKIIRVDAEEATQTLKNMTVKEMLLSPVAITVVDASGNQTTYPVRSNVTVYRNGSGAELRDILIGDTAEISLYYGLVSGIKATSKSSTVSGTVKELVISNSPRITIDQNGIEHTYAISREATFYKIDTEGTIYDIRLGGTVKLSLEGETATKVTTQTTSESGMVTGVIRAVNTSYGVIDLTLTNGQSMQVFLKKNDGTAIVKGGKNALYRDLAVGQTITAFGAEANAIFEAITIVVQ